MMKTHLLNHPLRTAGLLLLVEVLLTVVTLLVRNRMPSAWPLLAVSLLLVALFGVAYMAYYATDSQQRGFFQRDVFLITLLPPAYLVALAVYIASVVSRGF